MSNHIKLSAALELLNFDDEYFKNLADLKSSGVLTASIACSFYEDSFKKVVDAINADYVILKNRFGIGQSFLDDINGLIDILNKTRFDFVADYAYLGDGIKDGRTINDQIITFETIRSDVDMKLKVDLLASYREFSNKVSNQELK